MAEKTGPFIEAKWGWPYGSSGWNSGMDENLLKFSFLFDNNIDDIVSTLPTTPVNGKAYFLTTDNRVYFVADSVYYSTPIPKWFVLKDRITGASFEFNGTSLSQIENNSELSSRVDSIEAVTDSLGSAAFLDSSEFATPSYVDSSVTNLSNILSDNTNDSNGAAKVGYEGRTQYSRNKDRRHIFDYIPVGEHAAILAGTSTYDATSAFHAAIADTPVGGTIWLNDAGKLRVTTVNIDKVAICFRGGNSGGGTGSSIIQGTDPSAPVLNVTSIQFSMFNVGIYGLSAPTEAGADVSQDGILWSAPTWADNLDGIIQNCDFVYLRDCIDVRGRNIKVSDSLFSSCRRGISVVSRGIGDIRGIVSRGNRYHGVGKYVASPLTIASDCAGVWLDPVQGVTDVEIDDFGDFCVTGFRGFCSNAKISLLLTKNYGTGIVIDPTGVLTALARRTLRVYLDYQQDNPELVAASGLIAMGGNAYQIEADVKVKGCGGHGVQIANNYGRFRGYVNNAGQFANNTYDGVNIASGSTGTIISNFVSNGSAFGGAPSGNLARSAFNNQGTDTEFLGGNTFTTAGAFATAPFIQSATTFYKGESPAGPVRVNISWGTAMPTTGTYQAGSVVWNTAPGILGTAPNQYMIHGWRRVTTGSGHVLNTDWREMRMLTGT